MPPAHVPRVAVGGWLHETHTFATPPTTLAMFQAQCAVAGDAVPAQLGGSAAGIGGMIDGGRARGWSLHGTVYAAAMPGGMVAADARRTIHDALLTHLAAAMPLDGVLLALHGAAVAEDSQHPECDLLLRVRGVVGADVPIVVEFDMHGNISPDIVAACDLLVAYDTNPHDDAYDRGLECAALLERLMARQIRPTMAYAAPPLVLAPQATGTADLPLRAVHAAVARLERDPAVLAISVFAGFAYADTPWTGPSIVVCTDGQPELAQQLASQLGALLLDCAASAPIAQLAPAAAVRQALTHPAGPVILVDSADNIGGGTPGDGTDALHAMLEAGVERGVIVLADPTAVMRCREAGLGARVTLTVGGAVDRWHGDPLPVTGVVCFLGDGRFVCERRDHHFASLYGAEVAMGPTARLRVQGVEVVLTTLKTPPMDLAQLRSVGIVPEEQQMIVVKSAVAYRTAYLPIATAVIEMDTAGLCSANLRRFPYRHARRLLSAGDGPAPA
jgi:microcystin degradation protein MlrC